ncbi:MAG: DUF2974 domain-containing protein, partial [Treponema sp.]|nr:DUF2974 domain-containing protein [Treponema sp.]
AGKSKRFRNVLASGYWDILDGTKPEQFAAITFSYKRTNLVSFRGTDDTLIGWKEDCILAYASEIPSQLEAVKYLEEAMKKCGGDFILAGHSKGGNEAVYAAMHSDKSRRKRIRTVYNFDGPGFKDDVFNSAEYKCISNKIHSVYPECSFVGMIFNSTDNYEISESSEKIVMQHDPMSWNVYGTDFVHKDDFSKESRLFKNTFNEWTGELTGEQIIEFTEILFKVIGATGAKSTKDLEVNRIQKSAKIVHELASLDRKKREGLWKMIRMFMKIGRGYFPMLDIFRNPLIAKDSEL